MVAALFPGQGSQFIGMGKTLHEEFKIVRELFEEASDHLKMDFRKLCFEGPDSELTLTENTQPCLLLVSYGTFKVLHEQFGFKPMMGAGHSLGEYSALVSAGTMQFSDAMRAVRTRGQLMQAAVPVGVGGMAAVLGLNDEEVEKLCQYVVKEFGQSPLEPANYNAPGQVVVSGLKTLVNQLSTVDAEKVFGVKKRMKVIPLNVSAPFHCSLMKPAQDKMGLLLEDLRLRKPQFPIVQNVSAEPQRDPIEILDQLTRQISSSVLWTQSIIKMRELGVKRLLECGPGKVLTGLVKKIDSDMVTFNIQNIEDIRNFEKETPLWQG